MIEPRLTPCPAPPVTGPRVRAAALRLTVPDSGPARRRAQFAAGRRCAAEALKALGLTEPPAVATGPDRAPVWPAGIVGSITHSAGFAWAAAARACDLTGIGIDSESVMTRRVAAEVGGLVMDAGEAADETILPGADAETRTTLVMSAKESVYKCLYPTARIVFEFPDLRIREVDAARGSFGWILKRSLGSAFPEGFTGSGRFIIESGFVHTAVELPVVQAS